MYFHYACWMNGGYFGVLKPKRWSGLSPNRKLLFIEKTRLKKLEPINLIAWRSLSQKQIGYLSIDVLRGFDMLLIISQIDFYGPTWRPLGLFFFTGSFSKSILIILNGFGSTFMILSSFVLIRCGRAVIPISLSKRMQEKHLYSGLIYGTYQAFVNPIILGWIVRGIYWHLILAAVSTYQVIPSA